ncbi:MAG TPA: acetoin utilization protein acuB [Flavobacterium sp.]|jgi:hypothetical protein
MTPVTDYISNQYKAIDNKEIISNVLEFFNEVNYSHFPVVEESIYLGCIAGEDAETFDNDKEVSHYRYALEGFFARKNMIWMDLLELFARNHTNILPVLDENNAYIGYYEMPDIVRFFNETPFLKEPGGIIIVEKGITEYSMSQVVQIVESNNSRVLGLFISQAEVDKVQITIKVTLGGINSIIQTFRRYEYEVISEHQEDNYLSSLKERSDYLDKYLNI